MGRILERLFAWTRRRDAAARPRLAAWYDAARDSHRHWTAADHLSPSAANSPTVRRTLRARARYETANNPYAAATVDLYASYLIGRHIDLQITGTDALTASRIETEFSAWAREIDLHGKITALVRARVVDGEAFALLTTRRELASPVTLDIRPLEADRFTNPRPNAQDPADGITYDPSGQPTSYTMLRAHPGDSHAIAQPDAATIPADQVIHYYRRLRPEQLRGIPDLTAALPLFAMLRRYTLAVLTAAETAADIAGVVYTETPPPDAPQAEPWTPVTLERGALITLPAGWKIGQIQPAHPTNTYEIFKREILGEISRCLQIPPNVLTGDSSRHNYASGRLDWQAWHRRLAVDRRHLETAVLDRIFAAWLDEALLIPGYLRLPARPTPQWHYDGHEHVDPLKEAAAQAQRLRNLTTTLADEYARQGKDWETQLEQIARERRKLADLGLTPDYAVTVTPDDE